MYCTILYCAVLNWMLHFYISGSGGSVINWPSVSRSGSEIHIRIRFRILIRISDPYYFIKDLNQFHNNFHYFVELNDLLPIRHQMSRTSLLLKSQCSINRRCNIDPVLKFKCKFSAPPGSGSGFGLSSSNQYGSIRN